ncbi:MULTISPECIES: type IV pilus twitching motility protein PilT [Limnobacter]|uniref:Twitching motility protein PilT n=1 Tax=Limnobacter litoralis TaxID=481366 RepID=A0ABQ5YPG6_9BURK|nr:MULTISPECIES: type IV pilus twitching motility protein PilT [Limnobacter]GLR26007.1 twitching motility protein PilT [Limnobacter litoralis]HEX5487128.1 type IV pilus twitching motility protein PilT [Limnobacter sp.]
MTLTELLTWTVEENASDLHLSADLPPMVRVDGEVRKLNDAVLSHREVYKLIESCMTEVQLQHWEQNHECDFSTSVEGLSRFRVNAFMQSRGAAAAFRVVPSRVKSLDELGAPSVFKDIAREPKGLVLVTGPTGSGKSTTLAAMVNEINRNDKAHILTIEDPIEFVHTPINCVINQRELGEHTHSFGAALRSALREDPDVILVGEMRDLETIQLALTAAETGHLVFATLHTSSAPKTIDRIIDAFPSADKSMVRAMLSESLRAVICQTLLKQNAGGRVAAHEIMLATAPIRNLIREGKVAQMMSAIQTGAEQGMRTLEQSVQKLMVSGKITREVAMSALSTR